MQQLLRILFIAVLPLGVGSVQGVMADEGVAFFEKKIRPILAEHCYSCHSVDAQAEKKLKGGLLLDTREGSLRGGDAGRAVVPGEPARSLLLTAMKYDDPDLQMPPKKKLPDSVIADFERWIAMGAPDPREGESVHPVQSVDMAKAMEHWSFQPLHKPAVPAVADRHRSIARTPVDAFLLAKMNDARVEPAPRADPRTVIRRIYLDLTGLPPTPDEVNAFVKDSQKDPGAAVERVADRLLASPRYGERWGRHWLDVARYAETQGYERDENKPFAWRYRDWVIDAFNADMPFTRFVEEQIAGDELEDSTVASRVATGFLRIGTFDTIAADGKMARYDNLDDTLGVTMSAFLGMTIQCARCHDHKFEPLSQREYFALLTVFEPLPDPRKPVEVAGPVEREAFEKELTAWEASFATAMAELDALRLAALESADPDVLAQKKVKLDAKKIEEGIAAYRVAADKRDKRERAVTSLDGGRRFDDIIRATGTQEQKEQVEKLYRELKRQMDEEKPQPLLAYAASEAKDTAASVGQRLTPVPVPGEGEQAKNWPSMRLMIRGEVHRPGDEVPMGVPAILTHTSKQPPPALVPLEGSSGRRLWLAQWMTQTQKALLARTIVNRVWQYHFGRGFVANANELGVAGGSPTHPELLEWLAADLVEHGWRLKRLHRMIVTSHMYQLSAQHPEPDKDIDAVLYSRWRSRRLEAEAIRDSILAISGQFNLKMHGPSIYPPFDGKVVGASAGQGWQKSDEQEAARRSVYIYAKRALPLPEMEMLGSPDSSVSMPRRPVATTSVQALLFMNGRLVSEQAEHLARRLQTEAGSEPEAQVSRLWRLVVSREPSAEEMRAALAYLKQHPRADQDKDGVSVAMVGLCKVLLNSNEFIYLN